MPSRPTTRRFAPQPRSYGGYGGDAGYLYEAESAPPAWLEGLQSAVGAFMTARQMKQEKARQDEIDAEAREDRGLRRAGQMEDLRRAGISRGPLPDQEMTGDPRDMIGLTQGNGMRAMGTPARDRERVGTRYRGLTDEYYVDETRTPEARAREEAQQAAKQADMARAVQTALLRRVAKGDEAAIAEAAAAGISASVIGEVRPKEKDPEKMTPEDTAYQTRRGNLRAEQEYGVGNFKPEKPKTPGPEKPIYTSSEVRMHAQRSVDTIAQQMAAVPGVSALSIYNAVMRDGMTGDFVNDERFRREVQSMAAQALQRARDDAAKTKKPTGRQPALAPPPR